MASKSKKNKVKFKWTKELGFLLAALAVVIAATVVLSIPTKKEKALTKINDAIDSYNDTNSTSYYTLDSDNCFKEISHEKLVSQIGKNSGYMFVWYGTLSSGDYLQYLYTLNTMADDYDVSTVYLYYATYIEEATEDSVTDTAEYQTTVASMEDDLYKNHDKDVKEIDLESYPALFVYKDSELVFNSQIKSDSEEYSWDNVFNKAFGLVK